jgi:hypothetical protein
MDPDKAEYEGQARRSRLRLPPAVPETDLLCGHLARGDAGDSMAGCTDRHEENRRLRAQLAEGRRLGRHVGVVDPGFGSVSSGALDAHFLAIHTQAAEAFERGDPETASD